MKKKVALKELVIDEKLTYLRPINPVFVSRYRQAYRSSANMPLPFVEEKTNRITSGNHRVTAMREEYSLDHKAEVIFKQYGSEREVLEEFVKENANHGNALDGISRSRLSIALLDEGVTEEEIASLFNVPVKKIEKWGNQTVVVLGKKKTDRKTMPIKRGLEMTGKVMTAKQYETHVEKDRGIPAWQLANQLIRWLREGYVMPNERNMESLLALEEALGEFLAKVKKAA